jgi:hypothetical protein
MEKPAKKRERSDSELIDRMVVEVGDWRGRTFKAVRQLIKQADPQIIEELKWKKPSNPMGAPVYSHYGMVCVGNILKDSVRLTFFKGAFLKDPAGLFNGGLDSNTRRWIDVHEGDKINEPALKNLFRQAVALNSKDKK